MRFLAVFLFIMLMSSAQAQYAVPAQEKEFRYLAQIEVHTTTELMQLLERAEHLFDQGDYKSGATPVAFVLHGAEANALLASNYQQNKSLVDLAARLSAFQVVDIKVCKTWMGSKGLDESQLPPFVETVPFGPGEKKRLMQQGYIYF